MSNDYYMQVIWPYQQRVKFHYKRSLIYSDYCKVQQLTVNISKSKMIVFNTTKKSEPILDNDCILEEVDDFKYLGITLSCKGNM